MLTADQARLRARNDVVVYNEVKVIELAILTAAAAGALDCIIGVSTMTNSGTSPLYYAEWSGAQPNDVLRDQMAQVMLNFTKLGYSIERKTNVDTGNTFQWILAW